MSWKTGDAELEGGEIRRTGEDKGRAEMERVVVYDNDDNRYLGNADNRDFLPHGPCGELDKSILLLRGGGGGWRGDYSQVDGDLPVAARPWRRSDLLRRLPTDGDEKGETDQSRARTVHIDFKIIQKNSRSLASNLDMDELLLDLHDEQWDVILVSETWRKKKEECFSLEIGHVWFGSAGKQKQNGKGWKHGVGILLHRRWSKVWSAADAVSERLINIDINVGKYKLRIIYLHRVWLSRVASSCV